MNSDPNTHVSPHDANMCRRRLAGQTEDYSATIDIQIGENRGHYRQTGDFSATIDIQTDVRLYSGHYRQI